jgi:hypothetical protein
VKVVQLGNSVSVDSDSSIITIAYRVEADRKDYAFSMEVARLQITGSC